MVGGFAFGRTCGVGNNPCRSLSLLFFSLVVNKEVVVADLWNPVAFNDWELEEVQSFLYFIQRKRVISSGEDGLLMKDGKNGRFSVKLFYLFFTLAWNSLFSSHLIWNPWVPTKVGFFVWEASWGKVLILDQLKKRGRALVNWCFLCGEGRETIDHLLLHCSKAKTLWDFLLAIFGVSRVFPLSVKETLLSWHGFFVGKPCKKAWIVAPFCIFWTILQERNQLIFEDVFISINRMNSTFLCILWSLVFGQMHSVERPRSLVDFLTWVGCN